MITTITLNLLCATRYRSESKIACCAPVYFRPSILKQCVLLMYLILCIKSLNFFVCSFMIDLERFGLNSNNSELFDPFCQFTIIVMLVNTSRNFPLLSCIFHTYNTSCTFESLWSYLLADSNKNMYVVHVTNFYFSQLFLYISYLAYWTGAFC
jgi:hypothetical protein